MYDLYQPPLLCLADLSEDVPARQLYFYSQEEEKREGDSSVQEYRTSLIRIVISNVGWNIFALPGTVNSAFLATHLSPSFFTPRHHLASLLSFLCFTYFSPSFLLWVTNWKAGPPNVSFYLALLPSSIHNVSDITPFFFYYSRWCSRLTDLLISSCPSGGRPFLPSLLILFQSMAPSLFLMKVWIKGWLSNFFLLSTLALFISLPFHFLLM